MIWNSKSPQREFLNRALAFLAVLSACVFGTGQLAAETLWQLGKFDESSTEFSPIFDPKTGTRRIDYSDPAQDPVFEIGRSDPARHWFSFQPGTANGAAGHREHPFTIQFDLTGPPSGDYQLNLALLAYSTRLPLLQIEINGRRGWFYQHPKLAYSAGDEAVFFLPHYSTARIECDLPAAFLKQGLNRLVLTPLDQPGDRDDVRPSGYAWPGNSGVIYDAISFERTDTPPARQPEVKVVPTIFFKTAGGQLLEQVDVFARLQNRPGAGEISLNIAGQMFTAPLESARDFGERRASFDVPEFAPGTKATVVVKSGDVRAEFPVELSPARKWTVFVVPNEHLDIGYTDHASKVAELQSRTVDQAIELIERHPDFRFTFDGSWVIEQFLAGRSVEQQARFVKQVREKKLIVPAVYGSAFTGFASLEDLIRSLYPSKRFLARHGLPIEVALVTDVPSYSWSWASVLAAADVKYFVAASDAYRGPFLLWNRFHETSPHWWEGPDGGRVLTWYSRHYHQVASLFGMPPQLSQGRESLPRFLQAYDHPGYRSDAVLLYGTQVENTALHPAQAVFVEEWNKSFAYPRLRYAGFTEALEHITARNKDSIPVSRGDGGPYWEDGLGANARITALARQNMQRVLSAEKFSTLASLASPAFRPDQETFTALWRNLLLTDEHTWHADQSTREPASQQSVRQGAVRDSRTLQAREQIDHLLGRGLSAMADAIRAPAGTIVAFNALNWPRSGFVELDLPKGRELIDLATGRVVPHDVLYSGNTFHHVRLRVPEVPAMGYRCLASRPSPGGAITPEPNQTNILESPFYRVTLDADSGAVNSIFDKQLNRELVNASNGGRLNQFLYVTGADALPNRLVQYSTVSPMPTLQVHRASAGRIVSVQRTAAGTVARLESSTTNAPRIETEIMLSHERKRIEFHNRVQKTKAFAKEGAYFAFPFALEKPQFRYASQNGFIDPAKDLLPGAGREWFAIHNWVAVSEPGLTVALVPVDAPLITLGDIARGAWPREFRERPATVFSYVMNNYTPEGYLAGQGGEFNFRYVLTSDTAFDPVALHRMALEALTPLELNEIMRNDKIAADSGWLEGTTASLLQIDQPNVALITWKQAEAGAGSILRFVELAGRATSVNVGLPHFPVRSARLCNAVEDDKLPARVTSGGFGFDLKPFGIVTVRLETEALRH